MFLQDNVPARQDNARSRLGFRLSRIEALSAVSFSQDFATLLQPGNILETGCHQARPIFSGQLDFETEIEMGVGIHEPNRFRHFSALLGFSRAHRMGSRSSGGGSLAGESTRRRWLQRPGEQPYLSVAPGRTDQTHYQCYEADFNCLPAG